MGFLVDIFDVLLNITSYLPAPILFGLVLFYVVCLLRVLIELL